MEKSVIRAIEQGLHDWLKYLDLYDEVNKDELPIISVDEKFDIYCYPVDDNSIIMMAIATLEHFHYDHHEILERNQPKPGEYNPVFTCNGDILQLWVRITENDCTLPIILNYFSTLISHMENTLSAE
ncbi:hypothetical protein [Pantoea phytobeneficialis]|uniref:Uncharacterized protein n=1 Tax=Pantoea phytobeneficialis TaxID=2052056 RepID=A0AAP9KP80_9GAMM|nr:hypothetical protein [Pantoea phytobeneficialis]MDO6406088.1 hypothetical protein [Pantoea phytobeneficialis]QGR06598.1 hypothetical protein CTZ24_09305 [Pantoea phytobeneficialis]